MTLQDAVIKYGPIINGIWADELKWMTICSIPPEIGQHWIKTATGNPTVHIYLNKDIQAPLLQALNNIKNSNLLGELASFDGCYEVRQVRGYPNQISAHSYGLALDINAKTNPLGGPATLSPEFIKCWTDAGWFWGGDFHTRIDPMHMSWSGW